MFVKQKSILMEMKHGKLPTKIRQKTTRAGNVAHQGRRWGRCGQMQVACRERAGRSRTFQVEARRAFPGPDFPLSAGIHFILKAQLVKTLTIVKLSTFQGEKVHL